MQQNQQRSQDITPQEIVAAHPNPTGIKFATALSAQQTAALTQRKAVLEAAHEEAKTDDRIYNSVVDDTSKMAALAERVRLKRIDGTMASHLTAIPFDSPEFKGIQQRATAQSLDRLQRIEAAKKEIDLRIAQTTEPSVTQKAIDEATKAKQEVSGTQPITRYQQQQLDLSKVGKTEPVPEPVQRQRVEEAAAMAGAHANVLQTPEKIAQDIRIAGETAKAVAEAKPEKSTPAEKKTLAFWERGKFAADSIAPLEEGIANKNLGQQAWLQFMPNATQSEKDQKYRQAQRQFTESHLRPESGAAISETEYANDAKTYFAQPGDTPSTLAQKRAARAVILEGMKTEAGAAYEQKYGKQPPKHEKGSDPGGIR
jgi:hypothetical protein